MMLAYTTRWGSQQHAMRATAASTHSERRVPMSMSETTFRQVLDLLLISATGMDAYQHAYRAALFDFDEWVTTTHPTRMAALIWLDQAQAKARQALLLAQGDPDERTDPATYAARVNALATLRMRLALD